MIEVTAKQVGGFLISMFLLASGAVVYLQETGKYKSCSDGWILMEDGMYNCPTRDIEPQWCHHGSDEGPENIGYRCYTGIPIEIGEETTNEKIIEVASVECEYPKVSENYGIRT